MCEIIQLPIKNVNYRFLYFRAKDNTRPIYEIWSDSIADLYQLCDTFKKLKGTDICFFVKGKTNIKKEYQPVPNYDERQKDGKFHAYIEMRCGYNSNLLTEHLFDFH